MSFKQDVQILWNPGKTAFKYKNALQPLSFGRMISVNFFYFKALGGKHEGIFIIFSMTSVHQ
jgi:hypothetical protein